MKQTIVIEAKRVEKFLRIAVCPGYCDRTGRARSRNLRLSSAAGSEKLSAITPGLSPTRNLSQGLSAHPRASAVTWPYCWPIGDRPTTHYFDLSFQSQFHATLCRSFLGSFN